MGFRTLQKYVIELLIIIGTTSRVYVVSKVVIDGVVIGKRLYREQHYIIILNFNNVLKLFHKCAPKSYYYGASCSYIFTIFN